MSRKYFFILVGCAMASMGLFCGSEKEVTDNLLPLEQAVLNWQACDEDTDCFFTVRRCHDQCVLVVLSRDFEDQFNAFDCGDEPSSCDIPDARASCQQKKCVVDLL